MRTKVIICKTADVRGEGFFEKQKKQHLKAAVTNPTNFEYTLILRAKGALSMACQVLSKRFEAEKDTKNKTDLSVEN